MISDELKADLARGGYQSQILKKIAALEAKVSALSRAAPIVMVAPVALRDTAGNLWSSFAAPVGTYTFNLQDANNNLPSNIIAVFLALTSRWAVASAATYLSVDPNEAVTFSSLFIYATAGGNYISNNGIVKTGSSNYDIKATLAGAASLGAFVILLGYCPG